MNPRRKDEPTALLKRLVRLDETRDRAGTEQWDTEYAWLMQDVREHLHLGIRR